MHSDADAVERAGSRRVHGMRVIKGRGAVALDELAVMINRLVVIVLMIRAALVFSRMIRLEERVPILKYDLTLVYSAGLVDKYGRAEAGGRQQQQRHAGQPAAAPPAAAAAGGHNAKIDAEITLSLAP